MQLLQDGVSLDGNISDAGLKLAQAFLVLLWLAGI